MAFAALDRLKVSSATPLEFGKEKVHIFRAVIGGITAVKRPNLMPFVLMPSRKLF